MRSVEVHVTQADIEAGVRQICTSCPVALAMTRAFGEPVRVGLVQFVLKASQRAFSEHVLPDEVSNWIARFDLGRTVEPFSFCVSV